MKYRQLTLIEEPSPFDSLETWETYLARVTALPDDDAMKEVMLAIANDGISMKIRGRSTLH